MGRALRVIVASIVGALIYGGILLLLSLFNLLEPDNPGFLLFIAMPFIAPFLVSAVSRSGVKLGVIIGLLTVLLGVGFFALTALPAPFRIVGPEGWYSLVAFTILYWVPIGLIGGAVGGFVGRPPIGVLEWVIVRVIAAAAAGAVVYNLPWLLGLVWPEPEEVLGGAWWLVYFVRPVVASTVVFLLTRSHIVKLGLTRMWWTVSIAIVGVFTILLGIALSFPILLLLTWLTGEAFAFGFLAELLFSPILILIGLVGIFIVSFIIKLAARIIK
ncbi:MAG: hypothetical protein P3X22_004495 [Thermoprotei archaeon]|nr:hypothetical protein [Thermoprotei archaeon]